MRDLLRWPIVTSALLSTLTLFTACHRGHGVAPAAVPGPPPSGSNQLVMDLYHRAVVNMLQPGEGMYPTLAIPSPNGHWLFTFHKDGTLELADKSGHVAWRTSATGDARNAYMDPIGDFTVCDWAGRYFWHSGTAVIGAHLVVEDAGRVGIYSVDGKLVWSTDRSYTARPTTLPPLNAVPDDGACRSPRPPAPSAP